MFSKGYDGCSILDCYSKLLYCFSLTHGITGLASVARIVIVKLPPSVNNATLQLDSANVVQALWEENVIGASLVFMGIQRTDAKVWEFFSYKLPLT